MNTNNLKRFAQEARIKLIEQIGAKLSFVLTADTAVLREQASQINQLRHALNQTTEEQLIEKVAYTWFNRLMALRFMDANDYQPLGIRIITPKDGYTIPELLDEAKRGNIPEELRVNRQRVNDLLDNRIPSSNPQNEAFKELLIASCNHLHSTFPFLFERINDYTELLMPDDLTSDFSIVTQVQNGMPTEDCQKVEIIGWLYQFYISEKKDEVFASKGKVKKEDIPAATQLFTPRWIVEYMVQNTVGKLWLQNNPKSQLREHMPYFIESASLTADDYLKVDSPEEIRLLDPASGSGHILVYGFDLFSKIYEEQGYNTGDIPKLIIEKNLYGFEIDERAAQLTALALMMKAREYQRRAFRKDIIPNVVCFQDLHLTNADIKDTLRSLNIRVSDELIHDLSQMQQATNFGSMIIPHSHSTEIRQISERLKQLLPNADVFQRNKLDELVSAVEQLKVLSEKYHCVVTNPPYMGGGNMNVSLSDFVKNNYPDSKADLMACFMDGGLAMLQQKGFLGMINQHSWMFLSSYESLRKKLIDNVFIDTLLHLGARTFPEIGGEVVQNASFTFQNNSLNASGKYIRLVDYNNSKLKRTNTLEAIQNPNCGWFYTANQKDFEKIPGSPIGYWVSNKMIGLFGQGNQIGEISAPRQGLASSNNGRFLKAWFEVAIKRISFDCNSREESLKTKAKWFPYNKGGSYRKWYGNNEFVVNWENDGEEILAFAAKLYGSPTRTIKNISFYFKPSITWSALSSGGISLRKNGIGFLFDTKGQCVFSNDDKLLNHIMGFLNSHVSREMMRVLAPTLDFNSGVIAKAPIFISSKNLTQQAIDECISISKMDWDLREESWNFRRNELLRIADNMPIQLEESYDHYIQLWKNKFFQLHKNEEELNKQFIEIYGLQEELTPDVLLEDITILQAEIDRNALFKLNKKIKHDPETQLVTNYDEIDLQFIASEIMAQFISYSVGCMFGRYSLDKEGLILANQGEELTDYHEKVQGDSAFIVRNPNNSMQATAYFKNISFYPDEDNIIPILDDEWFEDDIVGKFYEFLKVTFGETNFTKNLAFIEEQIGKDIRKYFTKDFYADHIQRYKKRPIYWMFSSPKGTFNVLIYMHRYTPDTLSNILNKYLREFVGKLKTRKEHLQHIMVNGSPSQITSAIKEIDSIDKKLIELQEYEREVLFPLATERIAIDLDDGVLVNYNKFGKALKEVAGLNDVATKKKVKGFDWIDTKQIR